MEEESARPGRSKCSAHPCGYRREVSALAQDNVARTQAELVPARGCGTRSALLGPGWSTLHPAGSAPVGGTSFGGWPLGGGASSPGGPRNPGLRLKPHSPLLLGQDAH